ncbi:MAG: F0F1 ATP synthase subunit B [Candidatus Cloacimonetes bacterium]|nr:F0F1 ATP synthase subunit B [Candidatus Cloacimonadota bacterium]
MINIDYTLILVILNFVVLLLILNKVLYKPIQTFLEERQKKINDDIDAARTSREEADKLVETRSEELKKSSAEIRKMKQAAKRDAEYRAAEILREAKENEKRIALETENQIALERKKVMAQLQGELGGMIADLSEKFLSKKLDASVDTEIIEQMLTERGEK